MLFLKISAQFQWERLDKFSKSEENLYERNVYLLHVISSKMP